MMTNMDYEKVEMEVVCFDTADIIITSDTDYEMPIVPGQKG